jgi:hypothetical protein
MTPVFLEVAEAVLIYLGVFVVFGLAIAVIGSLRK